MGEANFYYFTCLNLSSFSRDISFHPFINLNNLTEYNGNVWGSSSVVLSSAVRDIDDFDRFLFGRSRRWWTTQEQRDVHRRQSQTDDRAQFPAPADQTKRRSVQKLGQKRAQELFGDRDVDGASAAAPMPNLSTGARRIPDHRQLVEILSGLQSQTVLRDGGL